MQDTMQLAHRNIEGKVLTMQDLSGNCVSYSSLEGVALWWLGPRQNLTFQCHWLNLTVIDQCAKQEHVLALAQNSL